MSGIEFLSRMARQGETQLRVVSKKNKMNNQKAIIMDTNEKKQQSTERTAAGKSNTSVFQKRKSAQQKKYAENLKILEKAYEAIKELRNMDTVKTPRIDDLTNWNTVNDVYWNLETCIETIKEFYI